MTTNILKSINQDPFLDAISNQLVVMTTPQGLQLQYANMIGTVNDSRLFKVRTTESVIYRPIDIETGNRMLGHRVDTIEIESRLEGADLQSQLQTVLKQNKQYVSVKTKISLPNRISAVQALNLGPTVSTYQVNTNFNYMSLQYDNYVQTAEESSLAPSWTSNIAGRSFSLGGPFPFNTGGPYTNPGQQVVVPQYSSETDMSLFPYYNRIKISNQVSNQFSNVLGELEISSNFLDGYFNLPKSDAIQFNIQPEDGGSVINQNTPFFDVVEWIQMGGLGDSGNMFDLSTTEPVFNDIGLQLRKRAFQLSLNNMANSNLRSYMDIVNNKDCYLEDFAYEINKFKNNLNNPNQTFIIRAEDNVSIFDDTQIAYGKTYKYSCDGHYVIVGNKYEYKNLSINGSKATVDVINQPMVIILPMPLFEENVVAIQPPPIYPQVTFKTQVNSSRDIKIYLTPTKGHLYAPFVVLTPSDRQQSQHLLDNKDPTDINPGFRFETYEEDGLYEIFRTSVAPRSLMDFEDKKLTEISMPYASADAIYTDNIRSNTKYYYLFRKINAHGLVSNPTVVYEVELLIDADDSKVVVSNYEFPVAPISQKRKTFQSLFQIKPAIEHVMFDQTQDVLFEKTSLSNTIDYLTLGSAENPIWTRKFKFRIRSTTSGKIIDYNVSFKLTKDKTEEDF